MHQLHDVTVLHRELFEAYRDSRAPGSFDTWLRTHSGIYAEACREYLEWQARMTGACGGCVA